MSRPSRSPSHPLRLHGRHAVEAALANHARRKRLLYATPEALERLARGATRLPPGLDQRRMAPAELDRLSAGGVHQGLVLEVDPLEPLALEDVSRDPQPDRPLVILDQVTDPHNVGAILRTAAAFDAAALITQDRHSPPESGALARAASGALELVPWVRVVNLARALDQLAKAGYWRIGLDGAAPSTLPATLNGAPVALVLGAEGEGLRPNVADHCDTLARLPISARVESLNVSNAAAVALYAVATQPR